MLGIMMIAPRLPDVPFRWATAARAGFSRWRFDELLREGRIRRVLYGVYQKVELPDSLEHRALAAALVAERFTVLCDRTAAWLHGVDTFEYRELEILPPLETYVLRYHTRTRRTGLRGGERDLSPCDICTIGPVRVTTPLRTALDLGCKLRRRNAIAALDAFMRVHGVTREAMEAELPRYRRPRGVVQLRQLVPLADPRAESTGESWTRIEIHDAGLPAPEPQYWIVDRGRELYRLDLAYPRSKVAVEYDGVEFHDSPEQREADRKRRTWLRDRGWTVIVVDKDSFTPEALGAWLNELRIALRLAA
jgi:hypothetical protein